MICTTYYCLGDMGPAPLLDPPDWDSHSIESRFTEESKVAFDTQVSLHWKDTYVNPFKVMQSNKVLLILMLKFMMVLVLTWMLILIFLLKIGRTFEAWFFSRGWFPKSSCCLSLLCLWQSLIFAKGGTLESRRSQGYASMASASTYMIGRMMFIAQRYLWKISVRESMRKGYLPPTTILAWSPKKI